MNLRRLGVLPAFVALLLSAPASAVGGGETPSLAATASTRPTEDPPPSGVPGSAPAASSSGEVTFTRALIPDPPTLGVPFRYEVRFQGPAGTRLFFPPKPAVEPFHLDGVACTGPAKSPAGGATAEAAPGPLDVTCTVSLRAFRLGRLKLPAIEVAWALLRQGDGGQALPGQSSGGQGAVTVPAQVIEVQGTLGNEASPALRAAYAPLPIRERDWPAILVAALLAAVAATTALTLLAVLVLRRWILPRRFEKPKVPAHVTAYGRLEALRPALQVDEPGRDVFFAFSEILREYLGNRYDFDALELTTREAMARLDGVDLQGVQPAEIEDVLAFADLVKFAKAPASRADAEDVFRRTRALVDRTLYVPPETPDHDAAAPEFVPAPVLERVAASAVDLALPFPLLAAARLALPDVPPAWGLAAFGAILVAWLALRDAAGPASPGHRLFRHRLLDERLDLLASRSARLKRNLLLLVPVIGWTVELLVLAAVTRTQRVGDQWARTAVAVPARRPRQTGRALLFLALAIVVALAGAWAGAR